MSEINAQQTSNRDTIKREFDIIRGARRGDLDEIKSALDEDPKCINKQDQINGLTALHFAASNGDYTIVDHLCDAKDVITNIPDFEGRTPSHLAWVIGRKDIENRIDRNLNEHIKRMTEVDEAADNVTILRPNQGPRSDP